MHDANRLFLITVVALNQQMHRTVAEVGGICTNYRAMAGQMIGIHHDLGGSLKKVKVIIDQYVERVD